MKIDSCWTLELSYHAQPLNNYLIRLFVRFFFQSSASVYARYARSWSTTSISTAFAIIQCVVRHAVDFDATICRFVNVFYSPSPSTWCTFELLLWIALSSSSSSSSSSSHGEGMMALCACVGGVDHIASHINQDKQLVSTLAHTHTQWIFHL